MVQNGPCFMTKPEKATDVRARKYPIKGGVNQYKYNRFMAFVNRKGCSNSAALNIFLSYIFERDIDEKL